MEQNTNEQGRGIGDAVKEYNVKSLLLVAGLTSAVYLFGRRQGSIIGRAEGLAEGYAKATVDVMSSILKEVNNVSHKYSK